MRWLVVALIGLVAAVAAGMVATSASPPARPAEEINRGAYSGLPVPRFVSLKTDRVNVRGGPSRDHDVTWVFTRPSLPVEIVAEFENWRRIRDVDGQEGWVYHSLLSGKRTAVIAPWSKEATLSLRSDRSNEARVTAHLEPGVLGTVRACRAGWCRLTGPGFDGWLPQDRLWGVYPNEAID
jgi:SH3-like domain-containing protein